MRKRHLLNPLTVTDRVTAITTNLSAIPPGANPFHYDKHNMGTSLPRGWMIMHEGYDSETDPKPLNYLILVNTRTGQRVMVDLLPESDDLRPVVYIHTEGEFPNRYQGRFKPIDSKIEWLHDYRPLFHDGTDVYLRLQNAMVHIATFIDEAALRKAWDEEFVDTPFPAALYEVKRCWLHDLLSHDDAPLDECVDIDTARAMIVVFCQKAQDEGREVMTVEELENLLISGDVRPIVAPDYSKRYSHRQVENWLNAMKE